MDRTRMIPDQLYLTNEAANQSTTVDRFYRRVGAEGKEKPASLKLSLAVNRYEFIRIICHRLTNGFWRVSCIDANLPALLKGHNGCPIRTSHDLALALTRLQFFVSLVVRSDCHDRIIPGVGPRNRGFVKYMEMMIQIQDPEHHLLIGSHVANITYQHKTPSIAWGESTSFKGRELNLKFYDKHAQRKSGILDPEGVEGTRVECIARNADRLANEVKDSKAFTGSPGAVVSTLSLESGYDVLRRNLGRTSGFGSIASDLPAKLSTTSKLLLMGLNSNFDQRHAVDLLLENYRRSQNPCERTFRTVNKEVREHAHRFIAPDALALVPPNFQELQWSDVRMPSAEKDFRALVCDMGAPDVPDPQILEAWSSTTMLAAKPTGAELAGLYLPTFDWPWKQTL